MFPFPLCFLAFWMCSYHPAGVNAQTCNSTNPCTRGCCGQWGFCGFGATFCGGDNCTGTCDAKADCDAGWGAAWSLMGKCPFDVCCSSHGYCGFGEDYCGDITIAEPTCTGRSSNARTVGYYEGWSLDRPCERMAPEQIPIDTYTHLNFAFAYIDPVNYTIIPMAENQTSLYKRVTALKNRKSSLKVLISIGGWTMTDPDQPTRQTFSKLAASDTAQRAFFESLIPFLKEYGFDGVDLDWEYPVATERNGNSQDYETFPPFLQNLKQALTTGHGTGYLLSLAIPAGYYYLQNYKIVEIANSVDWFNLMTYDYHGIWDANNIEIGPFVFGHTNLTDVKQSLDLLWWNNIDPGQINLGLAFYGRSFTLKTFKCATPGCQFLDAGRPGRCTDNNGTLSDDEIDDAIRHGATVTLDRAAAVKYATWNHQWVSYDDAETFAMKIEFANRRCLGGIMIWAVSQDSFGASSKALGRITGRM